jgi:hypothetical protein
LTIPTTNNHSQIIEARGSLARYIARWLLALILTLALPAGTTLIALFSIEGVKILPDLLPLLDGILAIDNVMVSSGKSLSEQDKQGRTNWSMCVCDDQSPDKAVEAGELPSLLAHGEMPTTGPIILKNASLLCGGRMNISNRLPMEI